MVVAASGLPCVLVRINCWLRSPWPAGQPSSAQLALSGAGIWLLLRGVGALSCFGFADVVRLVDRPGLTRRVLNGCAVGVIGRRSCRTGRGASGLLWRL